MRTRFKQAFDSTAPFHRYIFPLLVLLCILFLSLLRLSGTSIGQYDYYFNGAPSSGFKAGSPRGVRSDEWLVTSQLTIAQERANYPVINKSIGDGKDMSLITDVPYGEWSVLFKPQNLSFFILPFEFAFAFKWWFLLGVLLCSIYYFALRLLPGKYATASLVSVMLATAPFIFWWYQSITILPIAWGILIIAISLDLLDRRRWHLLARYYLPVKLNLAVQVTALSYALVCFTLVLYPPFQIPVVLSGAAFIIGYLLNTTRPRIGFPELLRKCRPVLISLVVALLIIGIFFITRLHTVHEISDTAYPGKRSVTSGQNFADSLPMFFGQAQYRLKDDASQYLISGNQSTNSTFLVMSPLFLLPLMYILYVRIRTKKSVDWIAILIIGTNILFFLHVFYPPFTTINKLFLLHLVPIERMAIGFGFLGMLSLVYWLSVLKSSRQPSRYREFHVFSVATSVLTAVAVIGGLSFLRFRFPAYFADTREIAIAGAMFILGFSLLLMAKGKIRFIGLVILTLVSVYSVWGVQPLYRGVGPLYAQDKVVQRIRSVSTNRSTWIVSGDLLIENIPFIANTKSVGGIQVYPDDKYWESAVGGEYESTYDRYAHIRALPTLDPMAPAVELTQADSFRATLNCSNKLSRSVTNILSSETINLPCYKLQDTVRYPARTLYIYQRIAVV